MNTYFKSSFLILLLTVFLPAFSHAQLKPRMEDGLAITHPRLVVTMEQRLNGTGIGLGYYLDSSGQSKPKLSNKFLAELPAYKSVLKIIKDELALYKKQFTSKHNTAGVGLNFHNRMFDDKFLIDDRAVFSLVGVINRMDQAYKDPKTCGETRLIYRLAYSVELPSRGKPKRVASRLPMTLNLVLNTKSEDSILTCAEIAQRWQKFSEVSQTPNQTISQTVDWIFGSQGPLSPELRDRSLIKKIEINLQLSRKAAAVSPDFGGHAVYLLKVLKWDSANQNFSPTTLENQVDRNKSSEFFKWLFAEDQSDGPSSSSLEERLIQLDQGTIEIPEEFLDVRAYSIAPGGLARAQNHVLFNKAEDQVIKQALDKISDSKLINIKSVEGFKRRLTDISCTGCHQTRAIGGFHFMGQDPYRWNEGTASFSGLYPGNAVIVPGSGHFFADLERRKKIVSSIAEQTIIDYSSGFSSKPQGHSSPNYRGWGSHCYLGSDDSFKDWTCDENTKCLQLHKSNVSPGMGVCVSKTLKEIGDPTEVGEVTLTGGSWFADKYTRMTTFDLPDNTHYVNSPQSAQPGSKTGGFPAGSIRTKDCASNIMSRHPEALCGALPAAKSGFNACLTDPSLSFEDCIKEYSAGVGLRACSRKKPCRDDYICAEPLDSSNQDSGVCVPPYFLFQFRVDGHPIQF